jgi:hypothetical protein
MHQYPTYAREGSQMVSTGTGLRIEWQEGPVQESGAGPNGSMPEQPVRAVLHRIEHLDQSTPCPQNRKMIEHLNAVLGLMDERTRERNSRGVLGTRAP